MGKWEPPERPEEEMTAEEREVAEAILKKFRRMFNASSMPNTIRAPVLP